MSALCLNKGRRITILSLFPMFDDSNITTAYELNMEKAEREHSYRTVYHHANAKI